MSDLLNSASLVLIPSGYKEDVLYSQVPTDGSADMAFTRASNGTRINSAGLVEVVPWNLISYSEDFDNAGWTRSTVSITTNTTTAPNGTTTADTIAFSSGGYVGQTLSNDGVMTFFVYAKYIATRWLCVENFNVSDKAGWFDLQNGVVGSTANGATNAIENVGNGWYKCSVTMTATSAASSTYAIFSVDANSSFTRSGSAYFWGAQLNIGSTAKPYFPTTDRLNVPRLTYQNGGGGCPSLLLEKQSTNLFSYSEDFSNSFWTKVNSTVTANNAISPDGTQNADKIENNSTIVEIYAGTSSAMTTGTASIFVKKGNNKYFGITINGTNDFDSRFQGVFDLDNGTIYGVNNSAVALTGTSAKIESLGNGWYRCSVTATFATSANGFMVLQHSNNVPTIPSNSLIWNNQSTGYAYIWGAQLEASSYPTSYIPTTSSSATRVADACYKTGISSLIGQTEGVIFYDGVLTGISNAYANLINSEKNTTGSFSIGQRASTGAILCGFFVGSTPIVTFDAGSYAVGTRTKIAFAYKSGSFALYVNGTQLQTSSATFTPVENIDDIYIGDETTFFNYKENTQVNQVALFKTRLTNAELASLTTI
jgi:hypothetical protein